MFFHIFSVKIHNFVFFHTSFNEKFKMFNEELRATAKVVADVVDVDQVSWVESARALASRLCSRKMQRPQLESCGCTNGVVQLSPSQFVAPKY